MTPKQIREGAVYAGKRGNLRCVAAIDGEWIEYTNGDRHNRYNAPDAAMTLKAFARWAQREVCN